MNNTWTVSDSLLENKRYFSKVLCEKKTDGNLIVSEVIKLNTDETKKLCSQFNLINSSESFQRFCICVIVGWVNSYTNGMAEEFSKNMQERCCRIPQHAKGLYLSVYQDTFYEYGLETFNIRCSSLEAIDELIRKHANV